MSVNCKSDFGVMGAGLTLDIILFGNAILHCLQNQGTITQFAR